VPTNAVLLGAIGTVHLACEQTGTAAGRSTRVIWQSFVGQWVAGIARTTSRVMVNMATKCCDRVSGALSFCRAFG
jgi:hypothetical protein